MRLPVLQSIQALYRDHVLSVLYDTQPVPILIKDAMVALRFSLDGAESLVAQKMTCDVDQFKLEPLL